MERTEEFSKQAISVDKNDRNLQHVNYFVTILVFLKEKFEKNSNIKIVSNGQNRRI